MTFRFPQIPAGSGTNFEYQAVEKIFNNSGRGTEAQPNRTGAKRTGAMYSMAEIRAQHDTSARMRDTLARLYAQQGKRQKQLL